MDAIESVTWFLRFYYSVSDFNIHFDQRNRLYFDRFDILKFIGQISGRASRLAKVTHTTADDTGRSAR